MACPPIFWVQSVTRAPDRDQFQPGPLRKCAPEGAHQVGCLLLWADPLPGLFHLLSHGRAQLGGPDGLVLMSVVHHDFPQILDAGYVQPLTGTVRIVRWVRNTVDASAQYAANVIVALSDAVLRGSSMSCASDSVLSSLSEPADPK